MMVPRRFLDGTAERVTALDGEWEFCEVPAGTSLDGSDLGRLAWRAAVVPGTVRGALQEHGGLPDDADADPGIDGREFLFRRRFIRSLPESPVAGALVFDGLATIADVWLNGALVLRTRNMFRQYVAAVPQLRRENELTLHFKSLRAELDAKRPRGRWVSRMIRHRNLRHMRTSLLGRMHGWAGHHPVVGPWRGVRLLENPRVLLERVRLSPSLEGGEGVVALSVAGRMLAGGPPTGLALRVGEREFFVPVSADGMRFEGEARLRIPGTAPWWTHDQGRPDRHPAVLALLFERERLELGTESLGFRSVERADGAAEGESFALRINGREVFCRGACWTPVDPARFGDDGEEARRTLRLLRDAGFNMVRVSGTMTYESDAFYEACDALGILVWQDFMFARMDYPDDAGFVAEVRVEAEQTLARLHCRASVAVYCGNTEVEQQAAMLGLEPYAGRSPLFAEHLRQLVQHWCPGLPYVSSSPTGGALPFHPQAGVAHYFGVGAYLRSLSDARESGVRFAAECLGFSNVPEDDGLDEVFGAEARSADSPRYRAGVPQDAGASWDFSDVTDHYVEQLFGVRAREMRRSDPERHLALSRVVPGEMMARAFGLWRSEDSRCRGALIWLSRDVEPGAGWGVLDSAGRPKAAWWLLRRACAPRAVWFTDEGLNGLRLHVRNDPAEALDARVRVRLVRGDGVPLAAVERELRIPAHSGCTYSVDGLLGGFTDSSWSYRFGPPEHQVAVAELFEGEGAPVGTAHLLTSGLAHEVRDDIGLEATAWRSTPGGGEVEIRARELALFVRIAARGWRADDNYFHIPAGEARRVLLHGSDEAPRRLRISALNARFPMEVPVE